MNTLRRWCMLGMLAGFLVAASPDGALADVLAFESFDYPLGSSVTGQNGGSGWAGPWKGPLAGARIAQGDDTLPAAGYYAGSAELAGNTRIERVLNVASEGPFGKAKLVTGGLLGVPGRSLYVGFLQRVSAVPSGNTADARYLRYYSFELKRSGSDRDRVLLIGHDDRSQPQPNNRYGVASVVNNGRNDREPGQFQTLGPENAKTSVIVVKITFGPEHRDVVEVFRNPPVAGNESAAKVSARLEGDFRFGSIALARFVGSAPVHQVDQIRVATSFREAVPLADEAAIRRYLALAEREVRKAIAAQQQRLAELAAKGVAVAGWQKRLDEIASAAERQTPRQRLQALRELEESTGLADVALGFDRLLLVKRHMFQPTHIYTEFSDGPYRPGGGIYVLAPVRPDGRAQLIFDAKEGIVRDPEVSYDGRRVLFSYRRAVDDYYHIHEMNVDGSGLRQVTSGPFHDLDPFYLPDGRIGMTSTRCKSRALCFWVRAATLFSMNADGTDIRPLTGNNVSEFTPQMLPDGRILYTRWEYMDKSAIFVQSLWSILPDGTRAQQIFGNNLIHPRLAVAGKAGTRDETAGLCAGSPQRR